MTTKTCGCTTATCGCCEGTQKVTPVSTVNRPGLDALNYRVGTHGAFFETMKARLSSMTFEAPGPDGQTMERYQPLAGLTTRDPSDAAIALLDGWATVADVLTFYQERIANEGYLRTATERQSVLQLARLVGYSLRPGVAATVFLAYTLDVNQKVQVTIKAGAQSQSVPGQDEAPQYFETSDDLDAQAAWNNLEVRRTRPVSITFENATDIPTITVSGISTSLKKGDSLLFAFGADGIPSVVRTVAAIEAQFEKQRTVVTLNPLGAQLKKGLPLLKAFVKATDTLHTDDVVRLAANDLLATALLGSPLPLETWVDELLRLGGATDLPHDFKTFKEGIDAIVGVTVTPPPKARDFTSPSQFVLELLQPAKVQPASSFQLGRSLKEAFRPGTDLLPQILVNFAPQIRETFYAAWSNATLSDAVPELTGVFAMRVRAPLFGAGAAPQVTANTVDGGVNITEWPLPDDEFADAVFLDQAHEEILVDSFAIIQRPVFQGGSVRHQERQIQKVSGVTTQQRNQFGISTTTTRLQFPAEWRHSQSGDDLGKLRQVLVYAQSDPLDLIDETISDPVGGSNEIPLNELYKELPSGRWVILSGERADIPGVTGVRASELLMISGLRQDSDPGVPGVRTTLLLATGTAYRYRRDSLTIYGNVVKATHGGMRSETLGAGDATQSFQSFTLKQPPLTFVPATTPNGADSTLKIYVNDVEWHETDTFAGLRPKDRMFMTKTADDSRTTVIFGNGDEGARLPTGVENVKAVYRNGIGAPGNVNAGQISMPVTRPPGAKEVVNPLPSSGGADKESRDQARENAPLAVTSLDRLVSVEDYGDFARTFAGIGKSASRRLFDRGREVVHVTIAGAGDILIDPVTSDLYRNLISAFTRFGDEALTVQVDPRELKILVVSARVRIDTGYLWDPVAKTITDTILDKFGFGKRALGQPALLCDMIALIQNIPGVVYVDIDGFGGIAEKKAVDQGKRQFLDLDDIAAAVQEITDPKATAGRLAQFVDVNLADIENGAIRPAQLAIFSSAVADTIVLNQIL